MVSKRTKEDKNLHFDIPVYYFLAKLYLRGFFPFPSIMFTSQRLPGQVLAVLLARFLWSGLPVPLSQTERK